MNRTARYSEAVAIALLLWTAGEVARAEVPDGGNLLGQRGMLRISSAANHPAGYITLGTDVQFYSATDLLTQGEDLSHWEGSLHISFTPIRFVEAALALHVISDNTSGGAREELLVAVGDPELSIKGGYEVGAGITLGALVDIRFPSGAGYFESAISATSVLFALLATWSGGSRIPLGVHLNAGFFVDGSDNLFESPGQLTPAQLFAARVSSFNRVVTRLGVEYIQRWVGPFVELSLEPLVGSGAPGFSDSPGRISFGLRGWPTRSKALQILAAADIGITGVGDGTAGSQTPGGYHPVLPRWAILVGLSYRFNAYSKEEQRALPGSAARECEPAPTSVAGQAAGVVRGRVVDSRTGGPVWSARIGVQGERASSLAVDAKDGSFITFPVAAGPKTLEVAADGYQTTRIPVLVPARGAAEVTVKLEPRTVVAQGTLRGTVKNTRGRRVKGATVLIPEADKTLKVDESGAFVVTLKAGEYRIIISAPGRRTQTKVMRIPEGGTVILNVELYR